MNDLKRKSPQRPMTASRQAWLGDTLESLAFAPVRRDLLRRDRRTAPDFVGYEIRELVGEGSFGAVYRAWDETLNREVALKVLTGATPTRAVGVAIPPRERLLNEAQSLARVRHRNVPIIYSVLDAPDSNEPAIVIEFIKGERLSDRVSRKGSLDEYEAAEIGIELCRALDAVHAAGLIHRDIKTDNVLRQANGRIVLTDFGLSVPINEIDTLDRRRVAGSPLFMSPEQIRGQEMGPWTDIYGLGVTLYNLTSGSYPVVPDDFDDLVSRVKAGDTVPLAEKRPHLSSRFLRIVARCLARDPSDRYRRVKDVESDLREVTRPMAA